MKADHTLLLQIAELDSEVVGLMNIVQEYPINCEKNDKKIADAENAIADAKQRTMEKRKELDGVELSHKEAEALIDKYKTQLSAIKKNDEYKMMSAKIAETEEKVGAIEEQVLALMDKVETVQGEFKEFEQIREKEKSELQQTRKDFDESHVYAKERLQHYENEKSILLEELDSEIAIKYKRAFDRYQDRVIVPLQSGKMCGGCSLQVTPQTINLVNAGKITFCDCGRILIVKLQG